MTKVLLGMSGGVDSSVSAILLQQHGYEVVGATLVLSALQANDESMQRAKDACNRLGIKHITKNYTHEFKEKIQNNFIEQYKCGFTPSPCILCNRVMKFPALLELANNNGCEKIATGHYARITKADTHDLSVCSRPYQLHVAQCREKDQSYMLYGLSQDVLRRTLFPLESLTKAQVNECAYQANLCYEHVKESQDNCFIEKGMSYGDWLKEHGVASQEGPVLDIVTGEELGRHAGQFHYTIGQRKGLQFGGGTKEPYYVIKKDVNNNSIYIGPRFHLFVTECTVSHMIWTSITAQTKAFKCSVKTRYRSKAVPCTCYPQDNGSMRILFKDKQQRPAAGQSAVFYIDNLCLGGGVIAPSSNL